jgi:hypothetical protein
LIRSFVVLVFFELDLRIFFVRGGIAVMLHAFVIRPGIDLGIQACTAQQDEKDGTYDG